MLITKEKEISGYDNYPEEKILSLFNIQYCILNEKLDKVYFKVNIVGRNIVSCIENLKTIIPNKIIDYEYNRVSYNIDLIDKDIINEIKTIYKEKLKEEMKEQLKDEMLKLTERIRCLRSDNKRLSTDIERLKQKIV